VAAQKKKDKVRRLNQTHREVVLFFINYGGGSQSADPG
jgi:hypothetical protein